MEPTAVREYTPLPLEPRALASIKTNKVIKLIIKKNITFSKTIKENQTNKKKHHIILAKKNNNNFTNFLKPN
jgi:hypothetical protein